MSAQDRYLSPVGRFVQGDAFEPQTKDQQGNLRVVKTGPNAGQPSPQYFMAVAFAKNDPAWPAFYAMIEGVARAEWPSLFPNPNGPCTNPRFAFKVKDGDGFDQNGKSNAEKEGFAGHHIVTFTSAYAPAVHPKDHYAPSERVTDNNLLRRGYFVRLAGNITGNSNPTNPGVYMNFDLVEIAGYGEEIKSGPDAAAIFGNAPASAMPAGASPTPALGVPPGAPVQVAPPPPPHTGYMTPPAPPPVPPGPLYNMLPPANGATREAMHAAGWTDEQLVAHGMMNIVQ